MPSIAVALILVVGLLFAPGQAAAQGVVPGFDDLPLMFELDADEAPMIDDGPPGARMIEAHARGQSSPQRVIAFYREALRQQGWRAGAGDVFERDGERLRLSISEPRSGEVEVRFLLSPIATALFR